MPLLISLVIIVLAILWYRRRHRNDHLQLPKPLMQVPEQESPQYDLSQYIKKPYLFDTSSEFQFFPMLNEIVGADHYVFPQINYSHLIGTQAFSYYENRRLRSHIERKSADFVVCDKKTCVPQLVINLDGSVHSRPDVYERDKEIDEILISIGLPILRITNEQSRDREFVKNKVSNLLNLTTAAL